jgi:hypothetical protein
MGHNFGGSGKSYSEVYNGLLRIGNPLDIKYFMKRSRVNGGLNYVIHEVKKVSIDRETDSIMVLYVMYENENGKMERTKIMFRKSREKNGGWEYLQPTDKMWFFFKDKSKAVPFFVDEVEKIHDRLKQCEKLKEKKAHYERFIKENPHHFI